MLELTDAQWKRLNQLNDHYLDDSKIFSTASKLGLIDRTIEYNGHFGRAIYFDVDAGSDLVAIEHEILWCIEHTPIE